MIETIRFVDVGKQDPYEYHTTKDAIISSVKSGTSPSTVVLLHIQQKYVSLGGRASISEKINLDYCRARGITVVRSGTPHDSSSFTTSMIRCYLVLSGKTSSVISLGDALETLFSRAVTRTLNILGIQGENPLGTNDLVVGDKKIGAFNLYSLGNTLLAILALSLDFNLEEAEGALISKRDMKTGITTTTNVLGRILTTAEVKSAFIEAFERTLGVVFKEGVLSSGEKHKSKEFLQRYKSDVWFRTGRWSPVKDYGRNS